MGVYLMEIHGNQKQGRNLSSFFINTCGIVVTTLIPDDISKMHCNNNSISGNKNRVSISHHVVIVRHFQSAIVCSIFFFF